MNQQGNSLVFHGAIVFLAGLFIGFPFGAAIVNEAAQSVIDAWQLAHLEGITNGLLLIAVGAVLGNSPLEKWQPRNVLLVQWPLIVTGYANIIASTIGAVTGSRGVAATGPFSNWVVYLIFIVGVIAVFTAMFALAYGLYKQNR